MERRWPGVETAGHLLGPLPGSRLIGSPYCRTTALEHRLRWAPAPSHQRQDEVFSSCHPPPQRGAPEWVTHHSYFGQIAPAKQRALVRSSNGGPPRAGERRPHPPDGATHQGAVGARRKFPCRTVGAGGPTASPGRGQPGMICGTKHKPSGAVDFGPRHINITPPSNSRPHKPSVPTPFLTLARRVGQKHKPFRINEGRPKT